jgi:transposase
LRDSELTKLLGWQGYRVYRHEIDEKRKTLRLWVRRKRGNRKLICSGCGRRLEKAHDTSEREVLDLSCMEFNTTVIVEIFRVCCPDCGVKTEKVPQLPSKAPFSKRFEDAVGMACESAAARQVAWRFGLPASTVRAIDKRCPPGCRSVQLVGEERFLKHDAAPRQWYREEWLRRRERLWRTYVRRAVALPSLDYCR